jgi:hypothetical protein
MKTMFNVELKTNKTNRRKRKKTRKWQEVVDE